MNKRKLRNRGSRPKAFFGESMAAAVAGATIAGGYQLAATKMANDVAKENARNEAKTIIQNAKDQAQAVKDQTAVSKEHQQEAQEFIREENDKARALQDNMQRTLLMMAGQQNVNDRLEAAKIRVKAGGKTRKLGLPTSLLRGGNMPFQVTDGGGVIPVGKTPEGFDLYEIKGNDHEHYHKSRGKYKSGVGIKFADGNIVEGEGNQNSSQGELMLVTPDDAYFISKHNIAGLNPAKMVEQGVHPLEAFNIQEQAKVVKGINDDGTKAKFGKKRFLIGGTPNLYNYANMSYPQIGTDTIGDTAVGAAYTTKNSTEKRRLRCGGKIRHKAYWGTDAQGRRIWIEGAGTTYSSSGPGNGGRNSYYGQTIGGNVSSSTTPRGFNGGPGTGGRIGVNTYGGGNIAPGNNGGQQGSTSTTRSGGSFSNWLNRNADLAGSFLSGGFNILGAALSASNARDTANIVANAQREGADIMAEAYRSLPNIDMNSIRREDYDAPNMIPALRAVVSHSSQPLAQVDRRLQRTLANAGRYSTSGAATQDRMSKAEVDAQDTRNQIHNVDEQQKQDTINKNIDSINEADKVNVMNKANARLRYASDYLNLLKYKNDTEITKILGAAGANTEGLINSANAVAQGRNAASQSWVNALSNIGLTASNTLSTMATRRANFENTMLGATTDAQINQIARSGSDREKRARLEAVRAAINSGKLSSEDEAKYKYYEELLLKSL